MRDNSKKVEETLTEIGTSGATFISEMANLMLMRYEESCYRIRALLLLF
jgi:hypothetical protein